LKASHNTIMDFIINSLLVLYIGVLLSHS